MKAFQFIFITIMSFVILIASIFTAKVYSLGLGLSSDATYKVVVISVLGPLLFMSTMLLGRFVKHKVFNAISYIVNVFGGIIFYLFIWALFLGIVLFVGKVFNFTVPVFVSILFLVLGFTFCVLGTVQALFIKKVFYDVLLPQAPNSWHGKKAILVTDTHFGNINHKKFSDKVVNKILEIKPDFVLHAGDFYDGPDNETNIITESWKKLAQTTPVFYTSGNHEEYGPYDKFIESITNAGVNVLLDKVTEYDGVQIAGIKFRGKKQNIKAQEIIDNLNIDKNKSLILINHHPAFQESAKVVNTDLMVSGHTHNGQFWPLNFIIRMAYGKYTYGINTDESLTTITSRGVGTAGPPMRLFNSPELVIINFRTK